jgi:hypothetical protein
VRHLSASSSRFYSVLVQTAHLKSSVDLSFVGIFLSSNPFLSSSATIESIDPDANNKKTVPVVTGI